MKIKPDNITGGTVIEGLVPGKDYVFQPIAETEDGHSIVGDTVQAKVPTDGIS